MLKDLSIPQIGKVRGIDSQTAPNSCSQDWRIEDMATLWASLGPKLTPCLPLFGSRNEFSSSPKINVAALIPGLFAESIRAS